jgi:hypothetical protein
MDQRQYDTTDTTSLEPDMQHRIDTDRIRQDVDLIELAGQVTTLKRWTAKEMAGPCPKCGGDDRLHVQRDFWFCRGCYPPENKLPHDAIAWVEWLHGVDFLEAIRLLDANALPEPVAKAIPATKTHTRGWTDATWQAAARHEARTAATELDSANGEAARAYLAGRAILPDTWRAWGLGCGAPWNPRIGEEKPAIILPWRDGDSIRALNYRFFGADIDKPARFSQKKDGERTLFGLDLLRGGDSLLLIEGELNAISAWQASREIGLDVVSFGPEDNASSAPVIELALRYKRVWVWLDKPDKVSAAMDVIPGAKGLKSVELDGVQLDANALLQRGALGEYLIAVLGLGAQAKVDAIVKRLWQGSHSMLPKELRGELDEQYHTWLTKWLALLDEYNAEVTKCRAT